jgi:hypothetical protein
MQTPLKVALSILIIIGGVIVMMSVAGYLFIRQIHVKETGAGDHKTVSVETPFGNMAVEPRKDLDPSRVGIPVYPGATRGTDHGGAQVQFDAGDFHKEFEVAAAVYYSDDPAEKVRQYYDQKFPDWKHPLDDKEGWHIETHESNRVRSISVKAVDGRTRITVASAGPPASN